MIRIKCLFSCDESVVTKQGLLSLSDHPIRVCHSLFSFLPLFLHPLLPSFHFEVFTMEVLTQIQNTSIMDFLFIREYSGWSDRPIIYLQQLPSLCGHFFTPMSPLILVLGLVL